MEAEARTSAARQALPVILMAAVIQGWALYGLHHAVKAHHWPATDQAWLIALYALAVFIPLTVQLSAEHARTGALWRLVTVLAAAYFYFGWHHVRFLPPAPNSSPVPRRISLSRCY
jgi:cytochrome bd-type quinol oxidase subunit 2